MQYILTTNTLTVVLDGRPRSLHRGECGEIAWDKAMEALKNDDVETLEKFIDTGGAVNKHFANSPIRITNGVLYYNSEELDTYPARKAVEFVKQDLPHEPLVRFLERMEENPSYRARQELYSFLEANNMPLTPEGRFLAYKKVKRIYTDDVPEGTMLVDIHSGTMNNDPGAVVTMTRNKVDENPDRTCSHGLHVCSYQYLPSFGAGHWDTVVAVEVDPANVVAVPHDYHNAKMRVCRYRVLEEIEYEGRESQHYWGDRAVVDDYVLESDENEDEAEDEDFDTEDDLSNLVEDFEGRYGVTFVHDALGTRLKLRSSGTEVAPMDTQDRLRCLLNIGDSMNAIDEYLNGRRSRYTQ